MSIPQGFNTISQQSRHLEVALPPRKKRRVDPKEKRTEKSVQENEHGLSYWKDSTPSRYEGISIGDLDQMVRFAESIVQDVFSVDMSIEDYPYKSYLHRLIIYSKRNQIVEVSNILWPAMCRWTIRNVNDIWCFRMQGKEEPLSGFFIKAFAQRFSVC